MADNLQDWANQWTLGDLYRGLKGGLNRATTALNESGIGLTPAAKAAYDRSKRPASFQEAAIGTPFVLNGVLGFKNPSGKFEARGDIDAGPQGARPDPDVKPKANPPAPGLGAPDAYGDPAARAREAEQRRMMQQYASKEYWDTEQGQAMLSLGRQMTAPKDAKLADYYGAQRAAGVGAMSEILEGLASVDDRYKEGGDLRKWAEANQGLALREYNKRFPGGFSNDEALGSLPAGYENTVSTYEAHGAPQESVDAFLTAQQARGNAAFRDLAKYPLTQPAGTTAPAPATAGGYVPDTQVAGLSADGRATVGEGAYGFDPEFDQLPIAQPPVQPDAARASNLAPATETAQQQRADELLQRFKGVTRGQLLSGI